MATEGKIYELPLYWALPPAGYTLEAPCRYRGRIIGHLLTCSDGQLRYQREADAAPPVRSWVAHTKPKLVYVLTKHGEVNVRGPEEAVDDHIAFVKRNQGK